MVTKQLEIEDENEDELSIEEIEALDYYSFMAHMNVPFFSISGLSSIDQLVKMCEIGEGKNVLNVGCGTGQNSIYIAKNYDCRVIGVDIAEGMILKAIENAEKEEITDKVEFSRGDAYDLQFEDNSFDVVITSFVSQFLDLKKALKEFSRVAKPGGCIGINEMYKSDEIPEIASKNIDEGEQIFRDLTELPFTFYTPLYWKKMFEEASLKDIQLEELPYKNISIKGLLKDIGGSKYLLKTMGRLIKYAWKSKKLRKRFGLLGKAKRILFRNKEAKKYIGIIICVGKKI
jgi:ubiquinone/menaquinone biosynthesis C-methylase UbiE